MRLNKNILFKILSSVIGAVFIFSAFSKLADIRHFTDLVLQYEINIFIYAIPFMIIAEIFLGVEMFFNLNIKRNALISVFLLSFFTLIYAYGYAVKDIEDCGCFGSTLQMSAIFVFIRNIILIVLSILVYKKTEKEKEDKFKKTIALVVLGFGIFFTGNYFRLPANMNITELQEPELLHKDITKTEFGEYYNFDADSTYMVFAFSYSCPHCLNSIENAKRFNDLEKIDKQIFFSAGSQEAKEKFFNNFEIKDIPIFENRISSTTVKSFPTTFIIKNNKIIFIYKGVLPSHFVFNRKYLNFE
jgi:hypothetical protein